MPQLTLFPINRVWEPIKLAFCLKNCCMLVQGLLIFADASKCPMRSPKTFHRSSLLKQMFARNSRSKELVLVREEARNIIRAIQTCNLKCETVSAKRFCIWNSTCSWSMACKGKQRRDGRARDMGRHREARVKQRKAGVSMQPHWKARSKFKFKTFPRFVPNSHSKF